MKTIYDLPKDMLVELITTIRSETIKEFTEKLNKPLFTPEEVEYLTHTATRNFYEEQHERFDKINKEDNPESISKDGTMFWCESITAAVHFKNYLISKGIRCVLLLDDESFLALTDINWKDYMNQKTPFWK